MGSLQSLYSFCHTFLLLLASTGVSKSSLEESKKLSVLVSGVAKCWKMNLSAGSLKPAVQGSKTLSLQALIPYPTPRSSVCWGEVENFSLLEMNSDLVWLGAGGKATPVAHQGLSALLKALGTGRI